MENATKALIMAAAILISVAVLSLAGFLVVSMGSYASTVEKENEKNQLAQFNSQFTQYNGKEVTIHDAITIANLAKENNNKYDLDSSDAGRGSFYIRVQIKPNSSTTLIRNFEDKASDFSKDSEKMNKEIIIEKDENGKIKIVKTQKYTCEVLISDITQRVYQVNFD